jgi:hypothetical protein
METTRDRRLARQLGHRIQEAPYGIVDVVAVRMKRTQ